MDPEHWVDLPSAVRVADGPLFSFSEDPEAALMGLTFRGDGITEEKDLYFTESDGGISPVPEDANYPRF
jgi:hypothetical protein